jgi:streptogramin lyase
MPVRLAFALVALASIAGCSQGGTAMPTARTAALSPPALLGATSPKMNFFNTPTQSAWPDYIVSGPQHALWFSEFYTDKIGRITTNGQITEFPLPDNADIEGITAGPDGNIHDAQRPCNVISHQRSQSVTPRHYHRSGR